MDELVTEFLTETNESLDELDLDLVNLEQNPNDKDLLGKIFRLVHTIKGTCGFLALPRLEKVAHHAENVLGRFRDGDLEVTPEYVTLIFESIDQIKYIVGILEESGSEPEGDDSALIEKLDAVYEGREAAAPASEDEAPAEEEKTKPPAAPEAPSEGGGNITQAELDALEAAFQNAPGPEELNAGATPIATEPPKAEPATPAPANETAPAEVKEKTVSSQTLRVSVDVLENLMTMVSELVLTRNQLLQILRHVSESEFSAPLQRLNHVVSDLQEGVMKTRMQPIGNAWAKLPRIIRDIGLELDKKLHLEMKGQETELDRQVLELIKDPLTHMVRNSGDHGIEPPAERREVGKPETGTIELNAYHEGGHIIIEISDDGRGLSSEKIKAKALSNGLATADELEEMSENQIHKFIFHAGLSTAEKVTSVSGRGVGMDVVRTNIEKIGGSIDLRSKEGKGSTFIIKIPLTLAIVSALIVEAGDERFAIPQLAVRELVMTSDTSEHQIEMIKGSPVFRLRDRLLPLVSLSDLLRLKTSLPEAAKMLNGSGALTEELMTGEDAETAEETSAGEELSSPEHSGMQDDLASRSQYIVVTQVGTTAFGIIVDRVFDTEEIVVKPVAKILKNIELFSGNTILGDGSVIMILDPNGIANQMGQVESIEEDQANTAAEFLQSDNDQKTALLLFTAGNQTPKAVPLSLVSRLENIRYENIERSSGQMMVQYRGQLMPIIAFDHATSIQEGEEKPILVFAHKEQSMGLIVDEIIDITEQHVDVQLEGSQDGLIGSAIIDDKATDVVDVSYFLQSTKMKWFNDHGDDPYRPEDGIGTNANGSAANKKRVLLVDDSPFFRNMLSPLLSVAGYDVTSLESPVDALKMCERGEQFDVIVSDIEMPDMDGFEFAQKVRDNSNWETVPMVALSSHATPQDIDRGMACGYSQYVAKFDRDTLLNTLSQTLAQHDDYKEAS